MFSAFGDVPAYPLVFPVFYGALAIFVLVMARHLRIFAVARPSNPIPNIPARFAGLVEYAVVQTRMFRDLRAGIMHAGIFWGFVLLTIGTANIATGGIIGIAVALGAILASQDVAGWIIGLVIGLTSVVLSALLWSSRQL